MAFFSDFKYGFSSSRSTANLLTVVSYRIARDFNRFGATRAVVLDISKAFDRVRHAGLLHKLSLLQIFGLISSFLSNRQLGVILRADITLSSKCDQASDLWQQLELVSELEFNLRDTVDWGKKWLVDFISKHVHQKGQVFEGFVTFYTILSKF